MPKSDLKVESDAAAFVTHAITTHLIQMARDHWCSAFDGILEIHNARKVTARQKRLDLYDRVARHLGLTISLLDPLFEGSFVGQAISREVGKLIFCSTTSMVGSE